MKIKREYLIEILIWLFLLVFIFTAAFCAHFFFIVRKNSYNLYFTDVDGVIKGSPIRFMGVTIGHVRKLKYDKKTNEIYTQIVVTKKGVKIPDGSKARVEFAGIVGSKSIEILPPQTNEYYNGIIAEKPLRIKDMVNAFKMYNDALAMMEDGLNKFNNANMDLVISQFAKSPDLEIFDRAIDGGIAGYKKFSSGINELAKREQAILEKFEEFEKAKVKK